MLVKVIEDSLGNVIAYPVSQRVRAAILADMRRNGAPASAEPELFLQQPQPHEVADALGPRALWRGEVNDGARVRVDDWAFRQMIGYAAN